MHLTVSFQNDAGRFEYHHCAKDYYPIGITQREEEGVSYLIATPEKALCDYIITTPRLPLRFLKDTYIFLEEDLRLDMDAFKEMNVIGSLYQHLIGWRRRTQEHGVIDWKIGNFSLLPDFPFVG